MVLASDIENNLKSTDLLNMDIILNPEKSPKKSKKLKGKQKPIKGKSHLDELLKTHKEKMKVENASKIQIFKQKRKRKLTPLTDAEKINEQCFQCGKVFNYKGYMEIHLRTHSKYKAFECNVCQKKFTQVSNLNLHLRTHSKEKVRWRGFEADLQLIINLPSSPSHAKSAQNSSPPPATSKST
jgi:hypothetical protein